MDLNFVAHHVIDSIGAVRHQFAVGLHLLTGHIAEARLSADQRSRKGVHLGWIEQAGQLGQNRVSSS
ncbi:MAG: hypothetical protein ACJ8AG_24130 [Ktedonobacteraceae bacterium]